MTLFIIPLLASALVGFVGGKIAEGISTVLPTMGYGRVLPSVLSGLVGGAFGSMMTAGLPSIFGLRASDVASAVRAASKSRPAKLSFAAQGASGDGEFADLVREWSEYGSFGDDGASYSARHSIAWDIDRAVMALWPLSGISDLDSFLDTSLPFRDDFIAHLAQITGIDISDEAAIFLAETPVGNLAAALVVEDVYSLAANELSDFPVLDNYEPWEPRHDMQIFAAVHEAKSVSDSSPKSLVQAIAAPGMVSPMAMSVLRGTQAAQTAWNRIQQGRTRATETRTLIEAAIASMDISADVERAKALSIAPAPVPIPPEGSAGSSAPAPMDPAPAEPSPPPFPTLPLLILLAFIGGRK